MKLSFSIWRRASPRWVFLVAVSAALVQASSITYSGATPGYPSVGPGAANLTIPKFDQSNGTLTSILFTLTAVTSTYIVGANPTSSPFTVTYGSDTSLIMPGISQFLPFGLSVYQPLSGSFQAQPGPFSFLASTRTGTQSYTLFGIPDASQYLGQGTLDLAIFLSEMGPDGFGIGPRVFLPDGPASVQTSWAAQLQVQYVYAEAPEPVTLWLVGAGLAAMGGASALWKNRKH